VWARWVVGGGAFFGPARAGDQAAGTLIGSHRPHLRPADASVVLEALQATLTGLLARHGAAEGRPVACLRVSACMSAGECPGMQRALGFDRSEPPAAPSPVFYRPDHREAAGAPAGQAGRPAVAHSLHALFRDVGVGAAPAGAGFARLAPAAERWPAHVQKHVQHRLPR